MIDCLNIYKFSFPFIEEQYEEVLFDSIFNDLDELLLYEELFEKVDKNETEKIRTIVLSFKQGKIELFFNKTNDYYIPKFQLNLFFKDKINNYLIKKIITIFETFGIKDYIFDYDPSNQTNLKNYNLISAEYLEKNFMKYNEKILKDFLKKINKDYLEEELQENKMIFYSFLYLIYRSFIFYKNYIDSQNAQKSFKELEYQNINTQYVSLIKLSETRLEHLDDLNLVTFKKYKKMLDTFFNILK